MVAKPKSVYSREATKFDKVVMNTGNIEKITDKNNLKGNTTFGLV